MEMGGVMDSKDQECPRGQRSRKVKEDQLWASGRRERKIKRKTCHRPLNAPSFSIILSQQSQECWCLARVTKTARVLALRAGGGARWTGSLGGWVRGDKMCSLHLSYTLTTGTQCSSVTHCHLPPGTWTVAQSLSWMRTGKEEKL